MDNIVCVKKKIEEIIQNSPVPEDPIHSKNTLEWLLKLNPHADDALKIAALGHDIERAIEKRKVRRGDYENYDAFKKAHALNSAKILAEIMIACHTDKKLAEDVLFLVRHHETGGTKRADLLRNADSISFFHVNVPHYFIRNGLEDTQERCLWGFKRLSGDMQKVVAKFNYQDKELKALITTWLEKSQLCL